MSPTEMTDPGDPIDDERVDAFEEEMVEEELLVEEISIDGMCGVY